MFFITYAEDRVTTIQNEVVSINTQVMKLQGKWLYHIAILYKTPGGEHKYYRSKGERELRKNAISAIKSELTDHFGKIPDITILRIERGAPKKLNGIN